LDRSQLMSCREIAGCSTRAGLRPWNLEHRSCCVYVERGVSSQSLTSSHLHTNYRANTAALSVWRSINERMAGQARSPRPGLPVLVTNGPCSVCFSNIRQVALPVHRLFWPSNVDFCPVWPKH